MADRKNIFTTHQKGVTNGSVSPADAGNAMIPLDRSGGEDKATVQGLHFTDRRIDLCHTLIQALLVSDYKVIVIDLRKFFSSLR